jgi:hypothetical protein
VLVNSVVAGLIFKIGLGFVFRFLGFLSASRVPFNSINRLINIELETGFWRRISGLFMEVLGLFFSFLFYFMKMFNIKLICN